MSQFDNPYAPSVSPAILEHQSMAGELATLSERFAGALIDGIIAIICIMPVAIGVSIYIDAMMGEGTVSDLIGEVVGGLLSICIFALIQGYFLATRSQTIGKIAIKTKIVTEDGRPISFGELYFKRYLILQLVSLVPYVGGFVGLVDALAIFRSSRKCLHDDIAGTKVIKINPYAT